jgi:selenophosphate synthase
MSDRKMFRARLKKDPDGFVLPSGLIRSRDGVQAYDTGQGWWTVTGTVDECMAFYNREFERGNMVAMNEVPA